MPSASLFAAQRQPPSHLAIKMDRNQQRGCIIFPLMRWETDAGADNVKSVALAILAVIFIPRAAMVGAQTLTVAVPISSQLTYPARVGQDFGFTFSPTTFASPDNSTTATPTTFSASPLPSWLSFDPPSRMFHGQPGATDEGVVSIGLSALGSGGETLATDTFDLTVTSQQGRLTTTLSVANQLATNDSGSITSSFPYAAGSPYFPGVRVPPNWSFSLGFEPWTYTNANGAKVYYSANMVDGAPLPDWLYFNNNSVTFDGVAPGLANATTFQVVLAGADVLGFQDIKESFNITVSARNFTAVAEGQSRAINMTADGGMVDMVVDLAALGILRIDDKPVKPDDVSIVSLDLAASKVDGLRYVEANSSLVGTVDKGMADKQVAIPINVVDNWGDMLNTTLQLAFVPSAFKQAHLPPSILTPGQEYKVDLKEFLGNAKDALNMTTTAVDPAKAASFISLDKDHVLSGKVPDDVDYETVTVHLLAVSDKTNASSRADIVFSLTGNGTEPATLAAHKKLPTGAIVAVAVISSIAGAILLLGLILLLLRKLRKRKDTASDKGIGHLAKKRRRRPSDMERGVWEAREYNNEAPANEENGSDKGSESPSMMVEHGSGVGDAQRRPLTPPPQPFPFGGPRKLSLWQRMKPSALLGSARPESRVKISRPIVTPDFGNAAFQAQLANAVASKDIVKRRPENGGSRFPRSSSPVGSGWTATIGSSEPSDHNPRSNDSCAESDSRGCDSPVSMSCYESHAACETTATQEGITKAEQEQYADHDNESIDRTLDTSAVIYDNEEDSGTSWTRVTPPPSITSSKKKVKRKPVPSSTVTPPPPSEDDPAPRARAAVTVIDPNVTPSMPQEEIPLGIIHFPSDSDLAGTEASLDAAVMDAAVIRKASKVSAHDYRGLESPIHLFSSPSSTSTGTEKALITPRTDTVPVPSRLVGFDKARTVQVNSPYADDQGAQRNVSHTAIVHQHSRSMASEFTQDPSSFIVMSDSPAPHETQDDRTGRPRAKSVTKSALKRSSTPSTTTTGTGSTARQPLSTIKSDVNKSTSTSTSTARHSHLPSLPSMPHLTKLMGKSATHKILLGVEEPFHFHPPLSGDKTLPISPSGRPETDPNGLYYANLEKRSKGRTLLKELPDWLKFDNMELWGCPTTNSKGDWVVRVTELLDGVETIVGRFVIEVSKQDLVFTTARSGSSLLSTQVIAHSPPVA